MHCVHPWTSSANRMCQCITNSSAPYRSAPSGEEEEAGTQSLEGPASIAVAEPQAMGQKNDLVVWLKLQPMQRRIYEACQACLCTLM